MVGSKPSSGKTITTLVGMFARTDYRDVAGAVTTGKTALIDSPTIVGALKPTTQLGLSIANQGASGITTAVGIDVESQTGATTNIALRTNGGENRLVGYTTLGSNAAPSFPLHINPTIANSVDSFRLGSVDGTLTGSSDNPMSLLLDT